MSRNCPRERFNPLNFIENLPGSGSSHRSQKAGHFALACRLRCEADMGASRVIGIRHVAHGKHRVAVVLTRNESGSIAGQCLLAPTERPIIDGPNVSSVIRTIEEALDALVFARRRKGR